MAKSDRKPLKKWQKALIAIASVIGGGALLFFLTILALMIRGDRRASSESVTAPETTTTVYEQRQTFEEGDDDPAENSGPTIPVTLSDEGLRKFESYITDFKVNYDYAEAYNIDAALAEYRNNTINTVSKHTYDIRVNGEFDADALYKLVKQNNEAYQEARKGEHADGWYKDYSDKQLKEICAMFCTMLPEIAAADPTVDLDTVCCYLHDLVILGKSGDLSFAGFSMDNRFAVNYDNLTSGGFALRTDDPETSTLYHEMMHAFQFACCDMKKPGENRMGIAHIYPDIGVNPLSYYWLLEGSAEMNMNQHLGISPTTYRYMVGYITTLNYISNLGSGDGLVQTEKLCFQRDTGKLFEQLDMTDEEEMREVMKMMFSIEILQKDNSAFYDWYQETYGVDFSDEGINGEESYLNQRVKEDAVMTMTKIFYRNLARQIHDGDATLQDAYYLIRLWEADIDHHFANNIVGYMMFFHGFYDEYLPLQDTFFEMLADENGLNAENVKQDFQNYSMTASDGSANCTLAFLSDARKTYITDTYKNSFYKKGYPTIRECQEQASEYASLYSMEDIEVKKMLPE